MAVGGNVSTAFFLMNEASRLISGAILGLDATTIVVNGKRYVIGPPTINSIAGAAYHLSPIVDGASFKEVVAAINDAPAMAKALSYFICGSDALFDELSQGTYDEVVDALEAAYSMISARSFTRLSVLARSVAALTANAKS